MFSIPASEVNAPYKSSCEEAQWNEDQAVPECAKNEEIHDQGQVIAKVEVCPAAVLDAQDHSLNDHETEPVSDHAEVVRREAVNKAIVSIPSNAAPDGPHARRDARHCPR